VAFAVGDAKLVASVVAGGAAVAVAPVVIAAWVGWTKVLTAPLPEPATVWLGSEVTPTNRTDPVNAQPPTAASNLVVVHLFIAFVLTSKRRSLVMAPVSLSAGQVLLRLILCYLQARTYVGVAEAELRRCYIDESRP
jgi:hypothetical protein